MIKPRNQRDEATLIQKNETGPVVIFTKVENRNISLLMKNKEPVAVRVFDFGEIPVGSIVSVKVADNCPNLNAVFAILPNGEKCFLSLDDYDFACNTSRHDGKICCQDVLIACVKSLKGRGKNARITTNGIAGAEGFDAMFDKVSHSRELVILNQGMPDFVFGKFMDGYDSHMALTDDKEVYEVLCRNYGELFDDIKLYSDEQVSLNVLFKVNTAVSLAKDRIVNLKSGGRICIDKTEAMYVIDVDSGKNIKTSAKDLAMVTDKEALETIAKLMVLRNMSGIILVDLINVSSDENRKELIDFMRKLAENDPLKPVVKDITGLGIMELTRKKTGSSFFEEFIRQN